eukprot:COSAG06_NODE_22887_length_709_cov_7.695082_1_plen_99_part_10
MESLGFEDEGTVLHRQEVRVALGAHAILKLQIQAARCERGTARVQAALLSEVGDGGGYTTELHLISPDAIVVVRSRHHDLVGAAQEGVEHWTAEGRNPA